VRQLKEKHVKILLALEVAAVLTVAAGTTLVSEDKVLYGPVYELLGASLGVLITTAGLYKIDQLT
jgi:hypothetical protein